MKPKFLADVNFNYKIISGLRRHDPTVDFRTSGQEGISGATDPEVLLWAARLGRILVSHDRHTLPGFFADFIQQGPSPGLIIVSQDMNIGHAIEDLLLVSGATTAEEWVNEIGYIPL